MSSTHDRHVEDLFDQVVDEPQTRRQKLPDALRQLEPAVVQEVEGLLAVDPHRHRVLDQDGEDLARRLLAGGVAHSVPPRIGRYVVQQHLGEGGMGAVYLARREPLGDLVALKLLRDPWGSPARRRRFASEQRLLARLNHRHIARLYDAGFEGETPWFAMEYVQGEPIVAYCRMHVVSLRDRLRLFRAACEAVSYAHRNLIVHLDLKPSNVLVSTEGEVKLVDFGIARQLSPNGGTEKTATVRRWLSLGYAAPEQLRGGPLDVQADVYSLGVILYELLAGTRPRDFDEVAFTEPAECLAAGPPRVSAAARTGKQGVHASKSAWRDLDLICETAMRADKAERYRSVDALIADIDSFLDDRPLAARHTRTSAYRIGKFLRRHRRPIAAAAVAAAVIAMVVAALSIRLVDARNRTVASEARVQSIHALMLNLFAGDDQAAGPADGLRVVALLDRGAREADALGNEPALQAELRHTLGTLYLKLGHPDRAEPLLISALSAWRSLFGERDARTIRTQQALAQLRIEQSRFGEAEKLARGALASAQNRFASTSREVAAARAVLGKVYGSTGAYDKAIEMLQPAVAVLSTLRPGVELSEALGDLANANYSLGRISESEALNRQALPIEQQVFGDRHPHVAVTLSNLGNIRLDYGDYAEGERLFRQALELNESWYGPNHPKAANSALMLGRAVAYRGRSDEAQALYARALSGFEAAYGTGHIRTAGVLSLMGDLARESGRLDDAERSFERAAAIFKSIVGDKHESYVHQLSNLGSVYYRQKRFAEGERVLRTAVDYLRERLPAHRYTALAEMRLAQTLGVRGDLAEAEQHALAAYRALQQALPGSSAIELQQARRTLRSVYERRGKLDLARALDSESSAETGPSGEP